MKANTYACIGLILVAVGSLIGKAPVLAQRFFDYNISDSTEGLLGWINIVTLILGTTLLGVCLGKKIEQKIRK